MLSFEKNDFKDHQTISKMHQTSNTLGDPYSQ